MNEGTFSIKIVDEDGDPKEGAEVFCSYGLLSGVLKKYTDEDGWVSFPFWPDSISGGNVIRKIWVNDELVKEDYYPEDGDTMSFTA